MVISIIIPVYNCEAFLRKCIESVVFQTYDKWELFIINDGSTDGSLKICEEYSRYNSKITVVSQSNHGPSYARNVGLKMVKGDYCMFVDGDDYLERNALEILNSILEEEEMDIIFFPNYTDIFTKNRYIYDYDNKIDRINIDNVEDFTKIFNTLFDHYYTNSAWNKIYNSKFLKESSIIFREDIRYSEDMLFNFQLFKRFTKGKVLDIPLYHYINHKGDSLCTIFRKEKFQELKIVYNEINKDINYWNPGFQNNLNNFYVTNINFIVNSLFNKDCKLNFKEKKKYISEIIEDKSVRYCLKSVKLRGIRNIVTGNILNLKSIYLLLLLGKITRIIKKA